MAHIGNVALDVSDLQRSEQFYQDVLGLQVVARIETDRVRAIIVGTPGIGSQIELAVRTDGPDPIKPSGIWKVFVFADDAQVLFDAAVAAGATPVAPPKLLEAFGIVLAFVEDPDGYLIEIGQRVSS